ncbi:hypothetical protein TorRG33x02_328760, partial [Trema orientale]
VAVTLEELHFPSITKPPSIMKLEIPIVPELRPWLKLKRRIAIDAVKKKKKKKKKITNQ